MVCLGILINPSCLLDWSVIPLKLVRHGSEMSPTIAAYGNIPRFLSDNQLAVNIIKGRARKLQISVDPSAERERQLHSELFRLTLFTVWEGR